MRICHSLLLIWLALLSRVSAERPKTVVATIPSEGLLQNGAGESSMKDLEVTGFITKNGNIFELPASRSMGSIEAREEPELEPGMTMCRYGTIVVYSDMDCNNFFNSSEIVKGPLKTKFPTGNESKEEDDEDAVKPLRKKKTKPRGNKRRPSISKNKKRNSLNRQKPQRKKTLKSQQSQRRRRNKLKNGGGTISQKKSKQRVNSNRKRNRNGNNVNKNKNRNGNNVNKRRRINKGEGRSGTRASAPLQFTILLKRN